VCFFTAYLEALTKRTPDQEIRRLVQEILEEEYMRPQQFERSHPALYRRFMRAVGFRDGEWDQVPALPATRAFIAMHLDMTWRSWLETLGAVGPGHEWAIPRMFPPLVLGIERSVALDPSALEYFRLHIDLDVAHGQVCNSLGDDPTRPPRGFCRFCVVGQENATRSHRKKHLAREEAAPVVVGIQHPHRDLVGPAGFDTAGLRVHDQVHRPQNRPTDEKLFVVPNGGSTTTFVRCT
jgi:hypothetical protein